MRTVTTETPSDVFFLFKESEHRRNLLRRLEEGGDLGLSRSQLFGYAELREAGMAVNCNLRRPRRTSLRESIEHIWDQYRAPQTGIGRGDYGTLRSHLKQMNRSRVVFATNDNVGLPAADWRAAGKLHAPLVYASIGLPERLQSVTERDQTRAAAYRQRLRSVDRFVAYGFEEAEWLREWLGGQADVHFVPFGVDPVQWAPVPARPARWDVLSVGSDPMRDFELLRDYALRRPNMRFAFITSSEQRKRLGDVPRHIDLYQDLPIEQVQEFIACARMIVLPVKRNRYSGATTTLLQCMAMGKAVVVSRVGAIERGYGLCDHENIRWVEPGSLESLAAAVDGLLRDDVARRTIGASARRHVETNLSWSRYIGALCAHFRPRQ